MSKVPLANRLLFWFAELLFKIAGWHTEGKLPDTPKYVIIATHTSGWDFIVGLTGWSILSNGFFVTKLSWMGKAELFRGPLGAFLKWIGGVPIERGARSSAVEQSIKAFRGCEKLAMAIAPEGTRKKATHWKTGFYHIAQGALVPIVFAYFDYKRKVVGIGPAIIPSGDIQADVEIIRDFYSSVHARHPSQVGDIAVRQS